jgi:dTDP-L-rhamnose 4-epimerase
MSRVLITGGAGFIGCRLADRLLASGAQVTALDNLHPQVHAGRGVPAEFPDGARFIPGDVTAIDAWSAVIESVRPDVIVHLAAETGTGQSLSQATRHASVNVLGTAAMIEALHASTHRPQHVVLASSRAVYGDGAWTAEDGTLFYPGQRTPEMLDAQRWDYAAPTGGTAHAVESRADITEPRPTNVYAATKLAQEHLLSAWCGATGVDLSVLRFQNVYGPGQSVTNSYTGVLTFFARTALQGETINVYEDGQIIRDFVYVDDVVSAVTAAIAQPGSRALDVGSGSPVTIAEVADLVAKLCDAPTPKVSGAYRLGDVRAASCDISRTAAELGYVPRWSLADGITEVLRWMPSTNLLDVGTARS